MAYGANVRRVPALGGATLTDVDIYKVLLLGKTERGIIDENGKPLIMDQIYSMNDFLPKCGGLNRSYKAAYVAKSFFEELESNVSCEMKVLSHVAADSAQAGYEVMDRASSAVKIFDAKAGRKGLADKSAFGNKIALKSSITQAITAKITADIATGATSAALDSVDNIAVGNIIKFIDTVAPLTAHVVVTGVTPSTKTIAFAALTLGSTLPVATTTAYRQDWKLEVAVKDDTGNYQKKEEWNAPFIKSETAGVVGLINDSIEGSNYIYLDLNAANVSPPADILPADLSSWTALAGGADGTAAIDANWKTLAETYLESAEFAIMFAPESSSIVHNQNMADFCTTAYKGMYYAQAPNEAGEESLKNFGASMRGSVKFAMLPSDKWIRVEDPTLVNGTLDIPKVGVDAAHWFNTYNRFGESKVAAGQKSEMVLKTRAKLLDANGLVHDDRAGVGDRLIRQYSINICKFTRGKGITNNSARTFSTDPGYKYQHQIMMFILYARSILAYLKEIEQDRAGAAAQEQHYNVIWGYMKKKFDGGHLFVGQKEDGSFTNFSDVCIIVNDFSINTFANIANGIEEVFLQFVAPGVIEEPVLSLASAGITTVKS
jgi:hypothetical protein